MFSRRSLLATVAAAAVATGCLHGSDHESGAGDGDEQQVSPLDVDVYSEIDAEVYVEVVDDSGDAVYSESHDLDDSHVRIDDVTDEIGVYTLRVSTDDVTEEATVEVCGRSGSVEVNVDEDGIQIVQAHVDDFGAVEGSAAEARCETI